MSYDIRKVIQLGEIANFKNGINYRREDIGNQVRIINVKELVAMDFINDQTHLPTVELEESKYKKYLLEHNNIVIARSASPGEVILYKGNKPTIYSGFSIKIEFDQEKLYPEYLFYYLKHYKKRVINVSNGTIFKNLNQKILNSIEVPIIDIIEQKSIANILSSLDDKIELNNKINKNLEEMAQALYKQWFVDFEFPNEEGEPYKSSGGEMIESELGMIPKGWEVDTLTNIANYKNGLAVKKYAPSEGERSIPVLKIKELRNGDCDENSDRVTVDFPEDYIIHNGDLIFSWSGTLMVDFWTGRIAGLNQHLFKVDSDNFDRWFYYYWTSYHLAKFQNIASSMATTMGHIKRSDLNKSKVLVPTQDVLDKGLDLFEPILAKIVLNRNQTNKLKKTRDTLLPKLMSGEIEVPIEG
jgi:type I restriction enzyme S subunit